MADTPMTTSNPPPALDPSAEARAQSRQRLDPSLVDSATGLLAEVTTSPAIIGPDFFVARLDRDVDILALYGWLKSDDCPLGFNGLVGLGEETKTAKGFLDNFRQKIGDQPRGPLNTCGKLSLTNVRKTKPREIEGAEWNWKVGMQFKVPKKLANDNLTAADRSLVRWASAPEYFTIFIRLDERAAVSNNLVYAGTIFTNMKSSGNNYKDHEQKIKDGIMALTGMDKDTFVVSQIPW